MATSFASLTLTDGSTTITFADSAGANVNYEVINGTLSLGVTRLRTSTLGGYGPYEDVELSFEFNVHSVLATPTADDVRLKMQALAKLLHQINRWRQQNGYGISPVLIKYQPKGSNLASPVQAMALEWVNQEEFMSAASQDVIYTDQGWLLGNRIVLRRRGLWIGADDSATVSSAQSNGAVMTCTLAGAVDYASPTNVTLGINIGSSVACNVPTESYLIVTPASGDITIVEAESLAGGALGYASAADSGNNARGGSVLRYTPASTNAATTSNGGTLSITHPKVAAFAVMKNRGAGAGSGNGSYQVYISTYTSANSTSAVSTPVTVVQTADATPKVFPLGVLVNPYGHSRFELTVTASATASMTLDIDYFVFVLLKDETAIVRLDNAGYAATLTSYEVRLEDQTTAAQDPTATLYAFGTTYAGPFSVDGLPYVVSSAASLSGIWLAPHSTNWRLVNATPAVQTATLDAVRHTGYIIPV